MTASENLQYTIIGTLIADPKLIGETITKLLPSDFSSLAARGLYETIAAMHLSGSPITTFTVLDKAGEEYGEAILEASRLCTDDLDYYLNEVRKKSKIADIQKIAAQLASTDDDASIEKLLARLNGMDCARRTVKCISAYDAAIDFINSKSEAPPEYFKWGISELDQKLYVEAGDFVVVGGFPSAGKTMLSLQFANKLADTKRVGYFSFETSPRKLFDRLISHVAQIPLASIKKHEMQSHEWVAATNAARILSEKKIDFISASGMTVRDVRAIALNQRYEVVFIDYLQLVSSHGANRYEEVTNISKDLHVFAQENGMTVVALAQLSRPEKNAGKMTPPNMSSFRESGQIEQDADVALLLWPSDPDDNRSSRVLKCGKNKDGERFRIELQFDGSRQTFRQTADDDVPDWVKAAENAPMISMEELYGK